MFDTIAAESQRLLNETMPAFVQNFLPHYGQPDADVLEELSRRDHRRPAAHRRQRALAPSAPTPTPTRCCASSSAGSATPSAGTSNRYSFNDPTGMCPTCEGIGWVAAVDESQLVDDDKSLNEGAIDFPNFAVGSWYWKVFIDSGFFDPDTSSATTRRSCASSSCTRPRARSSSTSAPSR